MTRGNAGALAAAGLFAGVASLAGAVTNDPPHRVVAVAAVQETVNADLVKRGAKLARRSGCASCHSLDGSRRPGPTWKGLYGRGRPLVNGGEVVVDEAYLRRSIIAPDAEIAQGFPAGMMPKDFGRKLSGEKIHAIIELIKSVR
jgi:cytochrome c oxidase subunit 2